MNFEKADRMPLIEWAPYWTQTIDRWYQEGLPSNLVRPEEVRGYFGLDSYLQFRFTPQSPNCPPPIHHGAPVINIKSIKDYQAFKEKGFLYPLPALDGRDTVHFGVLDKASIRSASQQRQEGSSVVWFTFEGFFWFPRTLFGIEQHLYAFYDYPDVMQAMNQDLVDYYLKVLDEICKIVTPDFMTFAEDMSYNHGPMLSKKIFDKFLAPYYKQIVPELKRRGIVPIVDSDGDIMPLIPWLEEVGIEGILPLERMAGVDVNKLRQQHPNFKLIGAFDKTIMHKGKDAMRAEFERLLPVMKQGGFIASVDHQTPPDVSLQQYHVYIELLGEYAEKAAKDK